MAKHTCKRLSVALVPMGDGNAAQIKLRVGSWRVGIIVATPGRVS